MEEISDELVEESSSYTSKRRARKPDFVVWMILTSFQLLLMGDNEQSASIVLESTLQIQNQALQICYSFKKNPEDSQHYMELDQDLYREKAATTIINVCGT